MPARKMLKAGISKTEISQELDISVHTINYELRPMTATRREAIQLLERVPEDKLTYVVQILSSIDGLISISDRRTKKIDLDQFVMPTTERGRNADEFIREMRDNDRL